MQHTTYLLTDRKLRRKLTFMKLRWQLMLLILLGISLAMVPAAQAQCTTTVAEGFDNITTLVPAFWATINHSQPLGTTNWFQGNPAVFPAQAGATNAYIGANFNNTGSVGTISNWLLTPPLNLLNGDTMSFWTRGPGSSFPDRLEVRMSTNGTSINVGTTATDVGDFTVLMTSINPTLTVGGYPAVWTQFTVTVTGVPVITKGRLAFRYFVTNGGLNGANSDYIGIDTFLFCGQGPTAADGSVAGKITDANGLPISGAVVNLSGTQNRKFISDANGNYRFDEVETNGFYSVTPSMVNYHFSPESRSFSQVGNNTDAAFTATRDSVMGVNRIDTPEYFVRQNYLDFLGREPDESGFNFWSDQILSCGADAGCRERRTINVSAAYFLSIESQQTGGLVDGLYRASYGRAPRYAEFMPDTGVVAQGVVVGRANWAQLLEANKQAFVAAWVNRADFRAAYDGLGNDAFVDALISHAGAGFNGDRSALVSGLNGGGLSRATVLRQVVENEGFVNAKHNEMFVMMEYFGYLRRDPDAAGYQFWLDKLNQFDGNFEQAEMVKAFIVSGEYRNRFGQ